MWYGNGLEIFSCIWNGVFRFSILRYEICVRGVKKSDRFVFVCFCA
jgi:hypothetical protein